MARSREDRSAERGAANLRRIRVARRAGPESLRVERPVVPREMPGRSHAQAQLPPRLRSRSAAGLLAVSLLLLITSRAHHTSVAGTTPSLDHQSAAGHSATVSPSPTDPTSRSPRARQRVDRPDRRRRARHRLVRAVPYARPRSSRHVRLLPRAAPRAAGLALPRIGRGG